MELYSKFYLFYNDSSRDIDPHSKYNKTFAIVDTKSRKGNTLYSLCRPYLSVWWNIFTKFYLPKLSYEPLSPYIKTYFK